MAKRFLFLLTACFVGAAALAGALLCERKSDIRAQRPTLECTDETILQLPYFDLLAAGNENRHLPTDVESYSLGDGMIHLILPEAVSPNAVAVYIRDKEGNYLARRVYDFTGKVMIGPWEVVLEHPSIPTVYFESEDPSVFSALNASADKNIICDGNMHICVGEEDSKENGWYREYLSASGDGSYKTTASLQGRGSTSWDVDRKRSYSLRLKRSENLLGLGKNRNWNLIGNVFDRSLIRNVTFNEISRRAGIDYQPNMIDVNLYVDGVYQGVYTLTTKISRNKNRVALRGGDYFYRLDPPEPENPITYESMAWFGDGLAYPAADLLYPEMPSGREFAEASDILQTFITARDDPNVPGFDEICDLDSLARYYWIQEASMNFDACSRSTYFYYLRNDSKVHFGPVWDLDLTLGSPYEKEKVDFSGPEGWKIRELGWYSRLFMRPEFVSAVYDVYYNGGVREALLGGTAEFEKQRAILADEGRLNFLFYGSPIEYEVPTDHGSDYDSYCDNMIDFYKKRVQWIDAEMEAGRGTGVTSP
ncbi:MAG: CotH kinase family protein [Lachnospiraceae bacterium]|nr:CotH kinase family protein [Lachnospiraceae bacterium]